MKSLGIFSALFLVSNVFQPVLSLLCYSCMTPPSDRKWFVMKHVIMNPRSYPDTMCSDAYTKMPDGANSCKDKCVSIVGSDEGDHFVIRGCFDETFKFGELEKHGIDKSSLVGTCLDRENLGMLGATGPLLDMMPNQGKLCLCGTPYCNSMLLKNYAMPGDAIDDFTDDSSLYLSEPDPLAFGGTSTKRPEPEPVTTARKTAQKQKRDMTSRNCSKETAVSQLKLPIGIRCNQTIPTKEVDLPSFQKLTANQQPIAKQEFGGNGSSKIQVMRGLIWLNLLTTEWTLHMVAFGVSRLV